MSYLSDMLRDITTDQLDAYRHALEEHDERCGEKEWVPTIIGLKDFTDSGTAVFEEAAADRELKYIMALGTILYTKIFSERGKEELGEYPPIGPAMSAVASSFFQMKEDGKVLSWQEITKEAADGGTI